MMEMLKASDSDCSVLEASSLCSIQLHSVNVLSPSESLTSGSQGLGLYLYLTMPAFYILKTENEREMNSYLFIQRNIILLIDFLSETRNTGQNRFWERTANLGFSALRNKRETKRKPDGQKPKPKQNKTTPSRLSSRRWWKDLVEGGNGKEAALYGREGAVDQWVDCDSVLLSSLLSNLEVEASCVREWTQDLIEARWLLP